MTIETNGSRNYSVTVISVPELKKAENSDNLWIIEMLGMKAIVDSSWHDRVGTHALLFPAEVQLSHDFCSSNNLYRDSDLNVDNTEKGYLDKNRRVRSLKLRGNISNALVLPTTALYRFASDESLSPGDTFDTIDGIKICQKYVVPQKTDGTQNRESKKLKKAFKRVDEVMLPMHFDTNQFLREEHNIKPHEELIITQKLHGTSCRLANTVVKRQLKWYEKLLQKVGVKVQTTEYDLVAGSRKVIKDVNNPNQNHYYSSDIWSDALDDFGINLPKNTVVYGELVGFTPSGTPIQAGHTYECVAGGINTGERYQLYVYRVAIITEDGELYDLSWDQVRTFCERQGLKHVPELDRMPKAAFNHEDYSEKAFRYDAERNPELYTDLPVRLSKGGTGKDEGIAIRVERGLSPEFYKVKNLSHYEYETKQLDTGEADLESQG